MNFIAELTASRAAEIRKSVLNYGLTLSERIAIEEGEILSKIYIAAKARKAMLEVKSPLPLSLCQSLEQRGFKVLNHKGATIQIEGVYHTITW